MLYSKLVNNLEKGTFLLTGIKYLKGNFHNIIYNYEKLKDKSTTKGILKIVVNMKLIKISG